MLHHHTLQGGLFVIISLLIASCDSLMIDDASQPPAITPVSVRIESGTGGTVTPAIPEVTQITATDSPPTATAEPTATPFPFGLESAIPVMSGICFESANDAAGQVFVMRSAEEHINLYDLAEHSELCRRPIIRHPFDFSNGRILAGTWTAGTGCIADHEILDYRRDDTDRTIVIQLRFVTGGDCPYELVRPFWVAIDNARDYEVTINVERAE